MNSKQRRHIKRKYIYRVSIDQAYLWTQLLAVARWLRTIQGTWYRVDHGVYGFTNEQDAIMFGLKFAGNTILTGE